MNGKLIVIEGTDGSGKETQSTKLYERLLNENMNVKLIKFPNYDSPSSGLVKMYLNGDFGSSPSDVNAYVASTFYAVDRFASYKTEWKSFYENGGIVIADRYTTSNMIHQASKIENAEERESFLKWLCDFEFVMFGLPKPDMVFFLDMPIEYSKKLIQYRDNKITGNEEKDIHEKDIQYLKDSYNISKELANKYRWKNINCITNSNIKTIDEIHNEIYSILFE